jgi:hypothetical protein
MCLTQSPTFILLGCDTKKKNLNKQVKLFFGILKANLGLAVLRTWQQLGQRKKESLCENQQYMQIQPSR